MLHLSIFFVVICYLFVYFWESVYDFIIFPFRDMRNWIDEQNSKFVEREKEAKGKVIAAKDKVTILGSMQLILIIELSFLKMELCTGETHEAEASG